ncbi:MAG: hypothetical protein V4722_21705 [Bacteroidota bacterium]
MLSNIDIQNNLGKNIIIEPYESKCLSPIGYDFRIGNFVFSIESGIINSKDGGYYLPKKSTVQILTKESLWVSSKIAGTFHSRVSLVSRGISHISTTLDPLWFGPLLITIRNNTEKELFLKQDQKFVTLIFYRLQSPTEFVQRKFSFVQGLLYEELKNQTNEYAESIKPILNDSYAHEEFVKKVEEANGPMIKKILTTLRKAKKQNIYKIIIDILLYASIVAMSFLSLYWNSIKVFFKNVDYDSKIIAMQFPLIVSLILILISRKRKT